MALICEYERRQAKIESSEIDTNIDGHLCERLRKYRRKKTMLIPHFNLLGQLSFKILHNFSLKLKYPLTVLSLFIFLEGVSLQTGAEMALF